MVDMRAEKVDPAGRADYQDTAVRLVSLGECFEAAQAHLGSLIFQIVIISVDLLQLFVKGAVCFFNQLNPAADRLQATDITRHKFLSSKMFPNCL
jgi:hypothetical protein